MPAFRPGKSLKDSSIKDQASAYYDRLDDAERKVLLVFLQQFSEILSGAVQGADASDPSDAPYNMSITDADDEGDDLDDDEGEFEEEPEEVITDEEPKPEDFDTPPAEEPAFEEGEPEEEDLTPPIRVNESQDLDNLRRRIRRIMLRG